MKFKLYLGISNKQKKKKKKKHTKPTLSRIRTPVGQRSMWKSQNPATGMVCVYFTFKSIPQDKIKLLAWYITVIIKSGFSIPVSCKKKKKKKKKWRNPINGWGFVYVTLEYWFIQNRYVWQCENKCILEKRTLFTWYWFRVLPRHQGIVAYLSVDKISSN